MMAGRYSRSSWRALTAQIGSPPNVSDAPAPMLLRQLRLFAANYRRIRRDPPAALSRRTLTRALLLLNQSVSMSCLTLYNLIHPICAKDLSPSQRSRQGMQFGGCSSQKSHCGCYSVEKGRFFLKMDEKTVRWKAHRFSSRHDCIADTACSMLTSVIADLDDIRFEAPSKFTPRCGRHLQ